jgi:hypothetical protein
VRRQVWVKGQVGEQGRSARAREREGIRGITCECEVNE